MTGGWPAWAHWRGLAGLDPRGGPCGRPAAELATEEKLAAEELAAAEVVRQGAQPVAAADRAAVSSAGPLGGGCGHRGFLFLIYISAA